MMPHFSLLRRMLLTVMMVFLGMAPLAAQSVPPEPTLPNVYCPVMPEEKALPSLFVEYRGERVYLCCPRCRRMFLEDPERYVANLPQFAVAVANPEAGDGESQGPVAEEEEAIRLSSPEEQARGRSGWSGVVQLAGRFHPVLVHFPIALVVAALLAELIGRLRRPEFFRAAGRFTILLAAVGAVAAAPTGWAAAQFSQYPGLEATLEWHRWLGTGTGLLILLCAVLGERAARTNNPGHHRAYVGLLLVTTALTVVVGHLGATLIYGPDHFRLGP